MSTGRYETANLVAIEAAHWCVAHPEYGLTYQSCRFCKVSWPKVSGLYKYGVRHYICAECRQRKLDGLRCVLASGHAGKHLFGTLTDPIAGECSMTERMPESLLREDSGDAHK